MSCPAWRWLHERGVCIVCVESLRAGVRPRTDRSRRFAQASDEQCLRTVPCRGSFTQGGVTMRDCSNNRGGFDRVLMAVAATFLTVSATSAMAAQRPAAQQRRRTRDRRSDPAPRTRQRAAPDHRRFQDGRRHRLGPRRGQGNRQGDREADEPTAAKAVEPKTRDQARRYRHRASGQARRRRQRRTAAGRNRHGARTEPAKEPVKAAATSRRPISRSPTSCATCSAPSRCAISTARASAPRSRSSTPRATTRRCGRRPAD